jgi:hypothetical protein
MTGYAVPPYGGLRKNRWVQNQRCGLGGNYYEWDWAAILMLDRPITPYIVGFEWPPVFRKQAQRHLFVQLLEIE